ncbi:sensor histidine kinase [Ideonella sp. BN130291]|uniref:sensor histidine kinase n=1 Tax=Ideonella sp. BN130291 TaxID=3112940 RepID=UPI002E27548A|nr:sensor histidine kinase [Ideonella sp. BN130291]
MRLRGHLLLLTLVVMAPMLVLGILGTWALVHQEQQTFQHGIQARTRALQSAVDAEVQGHIRTLQALAASQALGAGDLETFRVEALRVQASQPDWYNVNVSLPTGQQVLNLKAAPGAPLPQTPDLPSLKQAFETRRPVVSNMARGALTARTGYSVRVPVLSEGKVAYVVAAVIDPASIERLIAGRDIPPGWIAAVLDRRYAFVARSRPLAPEAGTVATSNLQADLSAAPEGWTRGLSLEGIDVYRGFTRSPMSGWSVVIAIPARLVHERARHAAAVAAMSMALVLALALAGAWLISRRLAKPITRLADAASAIEAGESAAAHLNSPVHEVNQLAGALQRAAEAVRERETRLRAEERAKDNFLAMLSHELRNPLAAMQGATLLLQHVHRPDVLAKARDVLQRQLRHMARLADDLLQVHLITRGNATMQRERIDLSGVARTVLANLKLSGRLLEHKVQEEMERTMVMGDEARLSQVVTNLLENAAKYTEPGGRIGIKVASQPPHAVLVVSDSGQGMSPDLIERAFELFVQGDQAMDRPLGGMGVGLALVKQLVGLHGGTVVARSAGAGAGSAFEVRLPLAD